MTWLKKLPARIKVVLTAAPTLLAIASAALVEVSGPIAEALPSPVSDTITRWVAVGLIILAAAGGVVRGLTKVFGPYVGLLAPAPPPAAVGAPVPPAAGQPPLHMFTPNEET